MPWIVHAPDPLQPVDEADHEPALVRGDGGHPGHQLPTALARIGRSGRAGDVAVGPPDIAQVVSRRERPGDRLERLGPRLEPVVRRPDLEDRQAIEDLRLAV